MNARAHLDALKVREGFWFAQKLYGFGAVPVTWQGWVTTAAYLALVALLAWRLPTGAFTLAAIVPVSIVYIWFIRTRTDGGFRWRWDPDRK